jgi:hypothetical protein
MDGGQSSEHKEELRPQSGDQTEEHPPKDLDGGPPDDDPPRDPRYYELVIDNDSGTYRPNAELLPLLKTYLRAQLPGLHIAVLDCQADEELQQKMKKEQRAKKAEEGGRIIYRQASVSSGSSISSSDLSDLDDMEDADDEEVREVRAKQRGTWKALGKDAKTKGKARKRKWGFITRGREKLSGGEENQPAPTETQTGQEERPVQKSEKVDSALETPTLQIPRKEVSSSPKAANGVEEDAGHKQAPTA